MKEQDQYQGTVQTRDAIPEGPGQDRKEEEVAHWGEEVA